MKKLSVSLAAVVAIVFAITSAFTTAKTSMVELKYVELEDYVTTSGALTQSTYNSLKDVDLYDAPVNSKTDAAFDCDYDISQDEVCAFRIDIDASTINVFDNGDFPASVGSIVEIVYNDVF